MPVFPRDELLRVDGLTVRVPGHQGYDIVRRIDLSLAPGDVLGLVGESGSGKTTLALALMGFARPGTEITGSVRLAGTDLIAARETERRKARGRLISYVPQDPSTALNPAMRIGRQLEEMLWLNRRERRRTDRSRIDDLLVKVRLPATAEFLARYPHQLSGGQLQRVSIAMAMVNKPKVIVFDEPTTGLDVTTQSHVLETIRELIGTENTAGIYVTHDLTVIGEIANRVGVMYSGLLIEQARTETILHHSAHPYSRRLVLATPSPGQRRELVGIAGSPLMPKDRGEGCPFAARCDYVETACVDGTPEVVAVGPQHSSRCRRAHYVQARVDARSDARTAIWQQRRRDDHLDHAALLSLRDVTAAYGANEVLHGVSITARDGECVALVGESGSGKTTLARCVSGIHPDDVGGGLHFAGGALAWKAQDRSVAARRAVQYIFQNPHGSLNPRRTIGQSIAQPLKTFHLASSSGARRARVRELLERVALPTAYEHRYPSQLSGGERQRVAIARALAAEPRLLVCDEITSSLDVSIQASILELLGELRRAGDLTLLFITHHLGLVRAVADQIVILNQGRVVEHGCAEDILDSPTDPYTVELLAHTPVMAQAPVAS